MEQLVEKKVDVFCEMSKTITRLLKKEIAIIHKRAREDHPEVSLVALISATSFAMMEVVATMAHHISCFALVPKESELGDTIIKNTKEYLDYYFDIIKKEVKPSVRRKKTGDVPWS